MYIHRTDDNTFKTRKRAHEGHPIMDARKVGDPTMYANDLFHRLTGYGVVRAHHRAHGTPATEDHRALRYAEDTLARMKGRKPGYEPDLGRRRMNGPRRSEDAAVANTTAGHHPATVPAMAYARDLFKRLRGLPALHRDDPAHRPLPETMAEPLPVAEALRRVLRTTARLLRIGVVERYLCRRRRRVAVAQLQALDGRLLADIGLRRNDIERTVDGLMRRSGNTLPTARDRNGSGVSGAEDESRWRLAA